MSEKDNIELSGNEKEVAKAPSKPAKADSDAKTKAKKKDKPGFFQHVARWFREMKSELKKVIWPTSQQTVKNTITVIICVLIIGAFIWAFDWLAAMVIDALLNLFGKV